MRSSSEKRRLALDGKLDLRPAYFVMAFMLLLSYVSSTAYSALSRIDGVVLLCNFGMRHFPSVRGVANLSDDANACAFVLTMQWLFGAVYLLVFFLFLSPFSKFVKVAVDKAVHRSSVARDEDRVEFGRIVFLLLVPIIFLADIGFVPIPTFLNGGLFARSGGEILTVYLLNSTVWMPAFCWLIVFATFMFYWSWFHVVANYKNIFDL